MDQTISLSCLVAGLLIACPLIGIAGLVLFTSGVLVLQPLSVLLMCCLAVLMILFDITMAVNNSMGNAWAFALAGIVRNTAAFLLVICSVFLGLGVDGALAGQVVGVAIGLATPSALVIWSRFRYQLISLHRLHQFIVYGFVGGLVLGYYMISHAICRNIIGGQVDAANAGVFGVTFDLLFSPIALIGSTLSYIHMPRMFSAGRHQSQDALKLSTQKFLDPILIFTTPFVFGGVLVGGELMRFFVDGNIEAKSVAIAPYAVVYAGTISVFSAVMGAIITSRHLFWLLIMIIVSLFVSGVSVFWAAQSADIVFIAKVLAGVMTMSMLIGLWFGKITDTAMFSFIVFFKVLTISTLMALVMSALITFSQPFGLFASIGAGVATYLIGAQVVGLLPVINIARSLMKWAVRPKTSS
jgi:O-antigen/teichoic acid export membrane protein